MVLEFGVSLLPGQLGSGKIVSLEVKTPWDEPNALGLFQDGCFPSPSHCQKHKGVFSDLRFGNLVGQLEVKLTKMWEPPYYWVLLRCLTLRLVHSEPPAVHQLQFSFLIPALVLAETSALAGCDSLYSPDSLIWGQLFALWPQFSDEARRVVDFQSSFFSLLCGPKQQLLSSLGAGPESRSWLFYFCLFRAIPVAYGCSQARGPIRAVAADLCRIWAVSVCNLHHSLWQCQIPNPLSEVRDQTCVLMDASQVH